MRLAIICLAKIYFDKMTLYSHKTQQDQVCSFYL